MKLSTVSLLGAVLLAFALRIWGITSGLPYVPIHIDEVTLVYTALSLVPQHGSLWSIGAGLIVPDYLFILYSIYFVLGRIFGVFTTPESFLIAYLNNPSVLILLGRLVTVFWGFATVYAVFQIGKRWFSERIGLLAAWFLAVSFLHVKESHYIKGDVFAGLIVLLIFDVACNISKRGKSRDYLIGGILAGCAFGVKYFPFLAASMLLAGHILRASKQGKGIFGKNIFFLFLAAAVTVFLLSPMTFLFRSDFISEFFVWGKFVSSSESYTFFEAVPFTFVFNHLRNGMGSLILAFSLFGTIVAFSRIKKFQYLLLIVFPLLFLASVQFWAKYNTPRYAIVLVPTFVILAAVGVDFLGKFFKIKKGYLTLTVALVLILPTILRSVKFDRYMSSPDTRALAKGWVEQNVAGGAKIVNVGSLKPYVLGGGAPLFLSPEATQREIDRAVNLGLPAIYLKTLLGVNSQRIGYDIYSTPSIIWKYDIETREHEELSGVSFYVVNGYTYIVTSSWAYPRPNAAFLQSLQDSYEQIAEFKPTVDFSYGPHDTVIEYGKVDEIDFLKGNISGPEVEVWRMKSTSLF